MIVNDCLSLFFLKKKKKIELFKTILFQSYTLFQILMQILSLA